MTDGEDSFGLDLTGELLKSRYRVDRLLAEGGMGQVYLAIDEDLKRRVVIKVPKVELLADRSFRGRFEREVQSHIGLEHPHVTKVLDAGAVRGVPWVALQFLAGGNLQDRLDAITGPMRALDVVPWLVPIARSLDYIHRKGFVHRDVKPGNIMFDEDGHALLGDFGIARAVGQADAGMTQTGTLVGSPRYMPPEAALGLPLSPAYDQYALAVIVYHVLSRKLPHEADTPLALLSLKTTRPPAPLDVVAPWLPDDAVDAVMKGLSLAPADRFATCELLAQAIVEGLSSATPPPASARIRRATSISEAATQTVTTGPSRALAGAVPVAETTPASRHPSRGFIVAVAGALAIGAIVLAAIALRDRTVTPEPVTGRSRLVESLTDIPDDSGPGTRAIDLRAPADVVTTPSSAAAPATEDGSLPAADTSVASPEGATSAGDASLDTVSIDTTMTPPAEEPLAATGVAPAPATPAPAPAKTTSPTKATPVPPPTKALPDRAAVPAPAPAPASAASPTAVSPEAASPVPARVPAGVNARGAAVAERPRDAARIVRIPGATYPMGGTVERMVTISPFWLDQTEVTWRQYKIYMKAHGIKLAKIPSWDPAESHPVTNLDWNEAARYCEWAGGRLPTEAEWELAAGGASGSLHPWGDAFDESRLNGFGDDNFGHTAPVGSFPAGASPFGMQDMSGNVSEWVADWHGELPSGALRNPKGPPSGSARVLRGGNFASKAASAFTTRHRASAAPGTVFANYGFRCAMND